MEEEKQQQSKQVKPKLKLVISDELKSLPSMKRLSIFVFPSKNGHKPKRNCFKRSLGRIRRELR